MAVNLPTQRKEVVDRAKTDVQSALPTSQPFLPNAFIGALIAGYGGRIFDVYDQLRKILLEMFPDTADGTFLQRWGSYVGINPNPSSQSTGSIVVTGTVSTLLPAGTTFMSSNGIQYTTNNDATIQGITVSISSLTRSGSVMTAVTSSNHNLATGMNVTISGAVQTDYNGTFVITVISLTSFSYTVTSSMATPATGTIIASYNGASVQVTSVQFGSNTNQPSGSSLSISTNIPGIDSTAIVEFATISGGSDAELDDDYRQRVLFRYQNPHATFNPAEIETTAKKVPGVTRVWVFSTTPNVGDVSIYFVRDNDPDIIPDPDEVTTVFNAIYVIATAEMEPEQVNVHAPTPVIVNFTFTALSPNTSTMQQAIQENLNFFFREGTNVSQNLVADAYRSVIYQTIDSTGAQVNSFSLSSPAGDITIAIGQLAVLGDFVFP